MSFLAPEVLHGPQSFRYTRLFSTLRLYAPITTCIPLPPTLRSCMVLMVCNTVRVFFWYGERFELPLLFQSIVLIVSQFVLMHAWCENDRRTSPQRHILDDATNLGKFARNFWGWNTLASYAIAIGTLATALATAVVLFGRGGDNAGPGSSAAFYSALGYLSLGVEAQLATPQVQGPVGRTCCTRARGCVRVYTRARVCVRVCVCVCVCVCVRGGVLDCGTFCPLRSS